MSEIIYKKHGLLFESLGDYYKSKYTNPSPEKIQHISAHNYNLRPLINDTYINLCAIINEMELGYATLLTPSCINAIATIILAICRNGNHIIMADNLYPQTKLTVKHIAEAIGATFSILDPLQPELLEKIINNDTTLIIIENPGSHSYEIMDTEYIAKIAHCKKALLLCDNSWATPIFHKPIAHGADIVVSSIGKYIHGRRDITMGYITSKNSKIYHKIYNTIVNTGITINTNDCYEVINSTKTLKIRMMHHKSTIQQILQSINDHKNIRHILHPLALQDHKHNLLFNKYFTGHSSVFSIVLNNHYEIQHLDRMIKAMKLFRVGTTWGGNDVNLIINFNPKEIRQHPNSKLLEGSCIRLYCGTFHESELLVQDILNGLNTLN